MNKTINQLLDTITSKLSAEDQSLITELKRELNKLSAKKHTPEAASVFPHINPETGCYQLYGNTAHYCPTCYDNNKELSKTKRLNSKLRVCSVCRTTISR
jgi:hypothetical protein